MKTSAKILDHLVQGSDEWLEIRKKHITATDASVIMRANPWKTPLQLYNEKISDERPAPPNERMRRGTELEPVARELFCLKLGRLFDPAVIVYDWAMASLDGYNALCNEMCEIKCPGERDHALAVSGKVPDHYYPQLQHQIYVTGCNKAYYFSFDGVDGAIVEIERDDEYIEKMLVEEKKFYDCLINKTPPEPNEDDFVNRNDKEWNSCLYAWKMLMEHKKEIEAEEEELRDKIISLCAEKSSKGGGMTVAQVSRKGTLDYSKIPELKNLDLEQYRKPSTTSWRITCH